jgi:hypothetical protein
MSQNDADKFGLDADERRLWVRLDDAKANLSLASGSARWWTSRWPTPAGCSRST